MKEVGFKDTECITIDFWLHRMLFERKIGKKFINYYMKKYDIKSKQNAMIVLNSNKLYKFLSHVCTALSIPKIFKTKNKWGYCFIVAKK